MDRSSSHTEVQYGVLYGEGNRHREAGTVEYFGIRPGGAAGKFSESDARYIANAHKNSKVVKRVVVTSTTYFDWVDA